MSGTAHSRKTYPRSFVLGGSHTIDEKTGELRPLDEDERGEIAATCSRHASELCTMVAKGATGLAAAAAALILAGAAAVMITDMARGGGTRKAKKSNRKRRATRRL